MVDTEEGFDWDAPLGRHDHDVGPVRELPRLHELCERRGIRPCYVVTWPLLADDRAVAVLEDLARAGADLGIHLHGWNTPPFGPPELEAPGFQGRLPAELERAKLESLAGLFRERFGRPARLHKAGRYGIGRNTPRILRDLGIVLDLSPMPGFDYRHVGGPDFRRVPPVPVLVAGEGAIAALPATGGFVGPFARLGPLVHAARAPDLLRGAFQRWWLARRIRLSPEGHALAELVALTRTLLRAGVTDFALTLHGPSLAPGWTPYVRDAADRRQLLAVLDGYLAFALGVAGLEPATVSGFADRIALPGSDGPSA